jgi:hypothetical protein
MSSAINIVGDEVRALHRMRIMMDLATDKLSREKFWEMATGQPMPEEYHSDGESEEAH